VLITITIVIIAPLRAAKGCKGCMFEYIAQTKLLTYEYSSTSMPQQPTMTLDPPNRQMRPSSDPVFAAAVVVVAQCFHSAVGVALERVNSPAKLGWACRS
jgi:hypothetical protein